MTDQFMLPGWSTGPATSPYWSSPTDAYAPLVDDPWTQIGAQWPQQPGVSAGTGRGLLAPLERLNVSGDQAPPAPAGWQPSSAGASGNVDLMSLAGKVLEPITSYWPTYTQMNREGLEQVGQGIDQIKGAYVPGVHDPIGFIKGLGNVALGTAGYVGSPISAGLRTFAGKPLEDLTGIPKQYTEFALGLLSPGSLGGLRSAAPELRAVPRLPIDEPVLNMRPLMPLEEIQQRRYDHAHGILGSVDPTNPQLSALDTSKWFPQSWDVYALDQEIARLKGLRENPSPFSPETQRILSALDNHHNLPLASGREFKRLGIDPNDYTTYLDAGWHRLLDTGPYHWTRDWGDYLSKNPNELSQATVLDQLNRMMKDKPFIWPGP